MERVLHRPETSSSRGTTLSEQRYHPERYYGLRSCHPPLNWSAFSSVSGSKSIALPRGPGHRPSQGSAEQHPPPCECRTRPQVYRAKRCQEHLVSHACVWCKLLIYMCEKMWIVLVGDKDLPSVDDLCQRHRLVCLPFRDGLSALDEDNEVVVLALVVDLGLLCVSSHDV